MPRGFGERLRRAVDLEHWPAFGASFAQLEQLLTGLAAGRCSVAGGPPASVTVISGDVHHSYLAAVDLPGRLGAAAGTSRPRGGLLPVSPGRAARDAVRAAAGQHPGRVACWARWRPRPAGARVPRIRWRITAGPWFENMIAVLDFDGRGARVRFDRAAVDPAGRPLLTTEAATRLS